MAKTKQVKKWFEARGHMVRNNHGSIFSTSGEPDLDVFLYFGNWQRFAIPIRVEVKRDATDKARPIQLAQMVHAEKHGVSCFIVWDTDQLAGIEELFKTVAKRYLTKDDKTKFKYDRKQRITLPSKKNVQVIDWLEKVRRLSD